MLTSPPQFWIGANDMKVEGSFVWTDEKKVDYTNWGAQQPDNLRSVLQITSKLNKNMRQFGVAHEI